MWIEGNQKKNPIFNINDAIYNLEGYITQTESKILLAKFLRQNIGLTWELLVGEKYKLLPLQEVILKGLFNCDNCLIVGGRGVGKSMILAVFSLLYSIFYPDKKVCLISANFRQARRILETCEAIVNSKQSKLLRHNLPYKMSRKNDIYSWKLPNRSEIFCLPLSSNEGLRGTRANCFSKDTEFLSKNGLVKFSDFEPGQTVEALSHKNVWRKAVVNRYQSDNLNKILVKINDKIHTFFATENHRWIRENGETINKLIVGDKLFNLKDKYCEVLSIESSGINEEVWCLSVEEDESLTLKEDLVCKNCVLIDEMLLLTKEIQNDVLRPFLSVKQDFREEKQIRDAEDKLIKEGVIKEHDRLSFPKNKYCGFSSASYEFQYLFEVYNRWIDFIQNPEQIISGENDTPPRYFVMRASYEAMTKIMDMTQINAAKAEGGENAEYFKREYRAMFSKMGDGYYSAKKMHECTIALGDYPCVQLKGDKDVEYLLSMDCSYGQNNTSDHFAMAVYMLVPQERKIILVHSYAQAGKQIKEHYDYLIYLLKYFNIVFICMDNSGSEFIHGFNESSVAKDNSINLQFLDVDFCSDNYAEEVQRAKNQYNLTNRKIIYGQNQTSHSNRRMNEHLQNQIDSKKVWFASPLGANEKEVKRYENFELPIIPKKNNEDVELGLADFIAGQDDWITATKNQTSLIEVKSTALGSLQYDLPKALTRETGPNRQRKDSYTTLLLAAWGARHLYEMRFTEEKKIISNVEPIFIF